MPQIQASQLFWGLKLSECYAGGGSESCGGLGGAEELSVKLRDRMRVED